MNIQSKPVAIISSACRLPLGITSPSQLWDAFCNPGDTRAIFTSPATVPALRNPDVFAFINPENVGGAGWIDKEGIESFDAAFFNVSPAEAEVLRPNTRLALELTWEALERAGIPPVSLRGKNVAVSIGVGTEDGWDVRRFSDDGHSAFDHQWAANSDPSGVSGRVSHFFDFRGPSSVVSTACSSGAFALRDGIQAILNENCEVAIVGAIATHPFSSTFDWAASVNVASKKGHCAAFSHQADGYVPSEGAVVFVLKRQSFAQANCNPILGVFRSLATGHNGSTRALATPHSAAQASLTRRSLIAAGILPSDVGILEAHGPGTRLGDTLESEAFRSVYNADEFRHDPLWVSSSKTVFGHCQATSALLGILKILACFEHKAIPPHHAVPLEEFQKGDILIPTTVVPLDGKRPFIAQVSSFGFTGSIASIIIEAASPLVTAVHNLPTDWAASSLRTYVLPFSARTVAALNSQIAEVYEWACETGCSLYDLGTLLSLCREHHNTRLSIVASDIHDLRGLSMGSRSPARTRFESTAEQSVALCSRYNAGHNVDFTEVYDLRNVPLLCQYLQTFPTYAFDRTRYWKNPNVAGLSKPTESLDAINVVHGTLSRASQAPSAELVAEAIASIVHIPAQDFSYDKNIFDLGIVSLNSIELADTLTKTFGSYISATELYSLLTVKQIYEFLLERSQSHSTAPLATQFTQADVDAWVLKYGAPLDDGLGLTVKRERDPSSMAILLTGANGMLGCSYLHELLSRESVARIYCLVRGDAWTRLSSAYTHHGFDSSQLSKDRDSGKLVVLPTIDLGYNFLGCGQDAYNQLSREVDTVVHLAWKIDFNLSVPAFQQCIEGTRNIAQFCAGAEKRIEYYFISSFSAYFRYDGALVPEQPLAAVKSACLDQGYAISKLIAEHALFSMVRNSKVAFSLRVVRIGQICGTSLTGENVSTNMVPMMIKSLPSLKSLLRNMPDVSWIPSDVCAAGLADFVAPNPPMMAQLDASPSFNAIEVLHLANPKVAPWPEIANEISKLVGLDGVALVSLRDYVNAIRSSPSSSELPVARLLPYFTATLEKGDLPSNFSSLDVKQSLTLSPALASCPEINADFLRQILRDSLRTSLTRTSTPTLMLSPPVLLFGPWSISGSSSGVHAGREIETAVEAMASRVRGEIGYTAEDLFLKSQLGTLINQLSAFATLKKRSISPTAVLGYCFGEYAAAVCAGILSLESAITILVRRAAALSSHAITGSMLNVFADSTTVKRHLLKLPFHIDIAIHAGPKHFVLSGEPTQIEAAQKSFQNEKSKDGTSVKTILIETTPPFHSSLMDPVINSLSLTVVPSSPTSSSSACAYISSLTGGPIESNNLGMRYWLRHMRDPVLFLEAIRYVEKQFPGTPLVDMGPGLMVSSIISRYKWEGCRLFGLDEFLSQEHLEDLSPDFTRHARATSDLPDGQNAVASNPEANLPIYAPI